MIVVVKTKANEYKKAQIRNRVFNEIDNATNQKIAQLKSTDIESVLWLKDKKMEEIPVKEFLADAEENDFFE